jgi:membrane-associated protease RseP (regulator of RpoE activity)
MIPPLDGFKLYEYTYEKFKGRQIKPDTLKYLTWGGYGFIAIMFIFSFFII